MSNDELEILQRNYDNLSKRHERLRGYVEDMVNDAKAAEIRTNIACLVSFVVGVAAASFVYVVFL